MPSHKRRPDSLPRIVLLDADVFFAPRMRDLFMHLREQELIHLHWTRPIEKEWARNVVAKHGASRDAIQNKGTQVTRYSMSAYLDLLYEEDPETVLKVVEVSRKKLKAPKLSQPEYVAVLVKNNHQSRNTNHEQRSLYVRTTNLQSPITNHGC